jgi:DNA polymerase-3 subunit epsilon
LCKRFGIDLSARAKHGALLDAELTARVYLELVGGRQTHLVLAPRDGQLASAEIVTVALTRPTPLAPRVTEQELEIHAAFVAKELGADAVWNWQ